jgi:WxL domain surface cell wall-binding
VKKRVLSQAIAAGLLFAAAVGSVFAAGGVTSVTVQGQTSGLSVTNGQPGSFANVSLNGIDQFTYGSMGTFTATDTRGIGAGWHIQLQASQFTCTPGAGSCPMAGDNLPLQSLSMAAPAISCSTGVSCKGRAAPPAVEGSYPAALDNASSAAVNVATAPANTGMGTYIFKPGTITCPSGASCASSSGNLQLFTPSWAYATTYNSTLTISASTGP